MMLVDSPRIARRAGFTAFTSLQAIGEARARNWLEGDDRRRTSANAFHRLCRQVCEAHGVYARVRGRVPDEPAILVANHHSYLDPLVLAMLVPLAPIAKVEVGSWPIFGEVARAHGISLIQRGCVWSGARVLRDALANLRAGVPVLNFPEGTTTDGGEPLPFHRGVFGLARIARVPIIPIAIGFDTPEAHWTGGAAFLPHYLKTAARAELGVTVRIGSALLVPTRAPAARIAAAARSAITRLLMETN